MDACELIRAYANEIKDLNNELAKAKEVSLRWEMQIEKIKTVLSVAMYSDKINEIKKILDYEGEEGF